jgi:hypothetical protein
MVTHRRVHRRAAGSAAGNGTAQAQQAGSQELYSHSAAVQRQEKNRIHWRQRRTGRIAATHHTVTTQCTGADSSAQLPRAIHVHHHHHVAPSAIIDPPPLLVPIAAHLIRRAFPDGARAVASDAAHDLRLFTARCATPPTGAMSTVHGPVSVSQWVPACLRAT